MSEAGKYQYSEKDCEIIYVEEKAPEPWIQRETFYDKDLPFPEDDDERLSDAKHIGSFMVPSPLMRLKSPSSMSSDKSDRSEDGRISPVPSLDRSIKSERRDSKSGLVMVSGGLTSTESLPQLYGLFDDSVIFSKESIPLTSDSQQISRSPLSVDAGEISRSPLGVDAEGINISGLGAYTENAFEDANGEDQVYSETYIEGRFREDANVNNIAQRDILNNGQDFSHENLKRFNHQSNTLSGNISHVETPKFMSDTAKGDKHDFRSTSTQMNSARDNARNNIPATAANVMEEFANSNDLKLGQEVRNGPAIQSSAGVTGSSIIAPAIGVGLGVAAAASFNENHENVRRVNLEVLESLEKQKRNTENIIPGNVLLDNSDLGAGLSQGIRNAVPDEAYGTNNQTLNVAAADSSAGNSLSEFVRDQEVNGIMGAAGDVEVVRTSNSAKEFEDIDVASRMVHSSVPVECIASIPTNAPMASTSSNPFDQTIEAHNVSQEMSIVGDNVEVSNQLSHNNMINPPLATVDMQNYSEIEGNNNNETIIRNSVSGRTAQNERIGSDGTKFDKNGDEICSNVKSGLGLALAAGVASSVLNPSAINLVQSEVAANISEQLPESANVMAERGYPGVGMTNATEVENLNSNVEIMDNSDQVIENNSMNEDANSSKVGSSNLLSNNNLANENSLNQGNSHTLEEHQTIGGDIDLNEARTLGISGNNNLINGSSSVQFAGAQSPDMENLSTEIYPAKGSDNSIEGNDFEQLQKQHYPAFEGSLGDLTPSENDNSQFRRPKKDNEFARDNSKISPTEIEIEAVQSPRLPDGADQLSSIPLVSESGVINHVNLGHEPGTQYNRLPSENFASQETGAYLNNRPPNKDYHVGSDLVEINVGRQSDVNNSVDLESFNSQEGRIKDNIEARNTLNRPSDDEIALLLSAYDSQLASESGQLAEHFASHDVYSDQYAKKWFESVFSDPKFSPALSETASSIYDKSGPTGLIEVALDLVRANSDELLALDSNEEILKKLNSDMNFDGENYSQLGSMKNSPEMDSSLRQKGTSEADDQLCDTGLELLVAKCRNAEDLIKQLSDLIHEMNEDIEHLTCENNKKSSRIKILENALQEKMKK